MLYLVAVAGRGVALLGPGEPIGVALGIAVLVLPVLGVVLVAREWWLAHQVQRMADELAASGGLDVDTLPRSPGGRVDRYAADGQFEVARAAVEGLPQDWGAWFRLGFAYDAARDRRRAREALRTAARLHPRPAGPGPAGGAAPPAAQPAVLLGGQHRLGPVGARGLADRRRQVVADGALGQHSRRAITATVEPSRAASSTSVSRWVSGDSPATRLSVASAGSTTRSPACTRRTASASRAAGCP